MKITKSQLKHIVFEVLNEADDAADDAGQPDAQSEEKSIQIVEAATKLLGQIDTPAEYQAFMSKIVAHAKALAENKPAVKPVLKAVWPILRDLVKGGTGEV